MDSAAEGPTEATVAARIRSRSGGGFDFVHNLAHYPELQRLGKTVVIGSFSYGDPNDIAGATDVFREAGALARHVTAASVPEGDYGPEVHVSSFLDLRYPSSAPISSVPNVLAPSRCRR